MNVEEQALAWSLERVEVGLGEHPDASDRSVYTSELLVVLDDLAAHRAQGWCPICHGAPDIVGSVAARHDPRHPVPRFPLC